MLHNFSVNSFFLIQRIYNFTNFIFSKFSDVSPAFTCASATDNLQNVCFNVNTLIPVPDVVIAINNRPSKSLKLLFGDVLFELLFDSGAIYS